MSGDTVNMYGGERNTGIVHHHAPVPATTPEQALAAVRELAEALRAQLPDADREALDEGLAELDGAAPGPSRRRTLLALAGIAATVGAVGQPLLDAVRAALELLAA
ncbi:hypothetical protein [Streptomyces omiyaensis]|uniref:Uncharacterized protein n=1 Tax=Streptomyces omiyaensis TaxID=68247 RepID=A0ABW7C340_9ACTN|nr:hypothetical protein [Streptomyces omiyaensis]GGY43408.1 hypothetical protein GCM10010363_25200 [Streptomyces omiyaensis]